MLVWLENDLSSTSQDWIVAYWHHPPYSKVAAPYQRKETDMRENVNPSRKLWRSGPRRYSHNWQRSYLIHGTTVSPIPGTPTPWG